MIPKHLQLRTILSGVIATMLWGGPSGAFANTIDHVEYSQVSGQVLVKISLSEPLLQRPSTFTVSNPSRLVIDLPDTTNNSGTGLYPAGMGSLTSINVVQAASRSRLVFNLSNPAQYETKVEGNALYITLPLATAQIADYRIPAIISNTPVAEAVNSVEPPIVASSQPQTRAVHHGTTANDLVPNQILGLDFRSESAEVATIKIDLTEGNALVDAKQQGNNLVLNLNKVAIPDRLLKRLDVQDFGSPVSQINATRSGKGAQLVITNRGDWEHSIRQSDSQLVVEIRRTTTDTKSLMGAKDLQGKVVSFNFSQPVPVSQMIGIFQDITGLNFIVMPGVSGEIQSLKMNNTPVDVAISIIARMYGLGFRRYDGIVVVGKVDDLIKYDKDEKERQQALAAVEPLTQETFKIRYRSAKDLVATLMKGLGSLSANSTAQTGSNAAAGQSNQVNAAQTNNTTKAERSLISERGIITFDDATNTIFIEETKTQLAKIRERIQSLDKPTQQVMIEARMVEAKSSFYNALGVKLSGNIGYTMRGTASSATFGSTLPASSSGGASAGTLAFSLYNANQSKIVNLELQAIEGDGDARNISSPKVLAKDGQKAVINYGTQVPQTTYSAQTGPSVTMIDALISLDVTPRILPDGKVELETKIHLDQAQAAIQTSGGIVYPIDKRDITTTVVVENGGTLVLGGMYKLREQGSVDRIPFFGDLPYVGFLFKSTQTTKEKNELLVFITPRIINESLTLQ